MAKKIPDRIRAGEARLIEAGVESGAPEERLAALIGDDADTDLAIAHRLGGMASAASAALLRRIEEGTGAADKDVRKEVKRALYRLEQRGVALPSAPVVARRTVLAPVAEGYVSAFDGRGDRLVWLVKPRPGNVLHLFAVVNDPAGLREVAANHISRKALREIEEELLRKHEIHMVAVDWRWADFVVHRAFGWAREAGRPVEGDYPGLRAQLTAESVCTDVTSPLALLERELAVDEQDLADSAEVFLEPEMRTWLLADDLARKVIEELMAIRTSPLVLNETQVTERFNAVTDRVVGEIFGEPMAASWQRRLEEMAYYFAQTRRPQRARQAAAAARAIEERRPPAEIPFCAVYVRRTLGLHMAEEERREDEARKGSLIVTPDQIRRR